MAVKDSAVAIQTTATQLNLSLVGQTDNGTCIISNPAASANAIYLGGPTVSITTGAEVPAGGSMSFDLLAGEKLFGVAAAITNVRVVLSGA